MAARLTYHRCCQQTVAGATIESRHPTCGSLESIDDTVSGCDSDEEREGADRQVSKSTEGGRAEAGTEASDETPHLDHRALDAVDDLMAIQQEGPPTVVPGYTTRPSAGSGLVPNTAPRAGTWYPTEARRGSR